MSEEKNDGLAAVIEVAQEAVHPVPLDPTQPTFVVVPEGTRPVEIDMSQWRAVPVRSTGHYHPATVASFSNYVERHADPEISTVWVHPTSGVIVAVIDDNGVEGPQWREHRVTLQLETTPEWDHWISMDGRLVSQEEFAEHIEVGLDDISEPDGADVLEMAQSFHAKSQSTFRQGIRLASGETQFQYDEEIQAATGKTGTLDIPSSMLLGLSPFIGEDRYKVVARVRYRIASGKLAIGYKLDRPELVKRDALEHIAEALSEKFPLTYVGSSPTG